MKKIFTVLLLIIAAHSYGFAQKKAIRPLKIGDTIPEIFIDKILRYKDPSLKLSSLKGKLIVIDFWATWCKGCIVEMPRLYELQKKMSDKILILAVTQETQQIALDCFNTLPSIQNVNLPIVYEDKILNELFPHRTIPHDIVINQKGIVKAITDSYNIKEEILNQIYDQKETSTTLKAVGMKLDLEKPFFTDTVVQSLTETYGMLTKGFPGMTSRMSQRGRETGLQTHTRLFGTNTPVTDLYYLALKKRIPMSFPSRIILNVLNKEMFGRPPSDGKEHEIYASKYLFGYDFYLPPSSKSDVYSFLKFYLDNYFNTESRLVKREVESFVVITKDSLLFKSKGGPMLLDKGRQLWTLNRIPITEMIAGLDIRSNIPIIDGTNYKGNMDITIRPVFDNFELLKSELNKNGLDLVKEKRMVEFILIEDRQ